MKKIVFFDIELNPQTATIEDIGAVSSDAAVFHKNDISGFFTFIQDAEFICGHNILAHDIIWLQRHSTVQNWGQTGQSILFYSLLCFFRRNLTTAC